MASHAVPNRTIRWIHPPPLATSTSRHAGSRNEQLPLRRRRRDESSGSIQRTKTPFALIMAKPRLIILIRHAQSEGNSTYSHLLSARSSQHRPTKSPEDEERGTRMRPRPPSPSVNGKPLARNKADPFILTSSQRTVRFTNSFPTTESNSHPTAGPKPTTQAADLEPSCAQTTPSRSSHRRTAGPVRPQRGSSPR